MPVYLYKCIDYHEFECFLPLKEYNKDVYCPYCGSIGTKIPTSVNCFSTSSKFQALERQGKEEGFIIREPGLDKDAKRNREYMEQERKKNIRKVIEETVKHF